VGGGTAASGHAGLHRFPAGDGGVAHDWRDLRRADPLHAPLRALGQALAAGGADAATPYRGWIETYAHPAFAALAARLEGLLDRYVTDKEAARVAYRRAMALELDFFTAHDYSMNQRARV
jgi:hypothetical protein